MKNRFFILVGLLIAEMNLCQGGMTWEEWTPENGIEDGRAALQEMLDAGKMPDENWQEKALAFINAFEKLKLQLQFFWRSQVGDGATDGHPWNGISDGCKPDGEKGYVKKDCPIVLRFWMDGHIGKYSIPEGWCVVYYKDNIPTITTITKKAHSKLKGKLKQYIYYIFEVVCKKELPMCAIFLNQSFCKPVSKLIDKIINHLKQQDTLQKQDMEILFRLYASYDSLDLANSQEKHNETQEDICAFIVECCYNDMNQFSEECKVWFTALFSNYNKNPYKANAGLGQYNLHLTKILEEFASKMKRHPKKLNAEFANIMKTVTEEWQQWISKYKKDREADKKLTDWYLAVWALEDALY